MRGGKRKGAGRKKLNHIRKTFYLDKEYYEKIKTVGGRTESDKINYILQEFFDKNDHSAQKNDHSAEKCWQISNKDV